MANTEISYLYRDADNYKVHHRVVVAGEMSEADEQAIISSLDSATWFIPSKVGLPDDRFGAETDADHPYFEFGICERTDAAPTIGITAEKLVQRFQEITSWDDEYPESPEAGNDIFAPRAKELLFQTLELLRKEIRPKFPDDWKDADDWLFSELSFKKSELEAIYKDHPDVMVYFGSAMEG